MTHAIADLKCSKNWPTDEEWSIPLSLDPSFLAMSLPFMMHLIKTFLSFCIHPQSPILVLWADVQQQAIKNQSESKQNIWAGCLH